MTQAAKFEKYIAQTPSVMLHWNKFLRYQDDCFDAYRHVLEIKADADAAGLDGDALLAYLEKT